MALDSEYLTVTALSAHPVHGLLQFYILLKE